MLPIEMMCKVLGVSRSGFYSWTKRKPSIRALEDEQLMKKIRVIHKKSKATYGSLRIREELKKNYVHVSRRRVARLMKKLTSITGSRNASGQQPIQNMSYQ